MTIDPTAVPTNFTHPTAELVWIAPCPCCGENCSYFQKPSDPQPRVSCPCRPCDTCRPGATS